MQLLGQSGERVDLGGDEESESGPRIISPHEMGVLQAAGEEELVVGPGGSGHLHAVPVHLGHGLKTRAGGNEVGRVELHVGRGERDLTLARGIAAHERDVPRARLGRVDHGPHALEGHDLDRDVEPTRKLSRGSEGGAGV